MKETQKFIHSYCSTLIALFLLANSLCCRTVLAEESALALEAENALGYRQYQKALNLASTALRQNPSDGLALICRARAELYFEKNAAAAKDFDRGFALVPHPDAGILLIAAKCFAAQRDDEKALVTYNRSLKEKVSAFALRDKGELLWGMNRHKEAFESLERASTLAPKEFWIYQDLADCYMQEKRYPEAMKNVERLIQLRPNEPRGYVARAKIYEKTGKPDLAKRDLKRADELGAAMF